jgi:hypothetical protein
MMALLDNVTIAKNNLRLYLLNSNSNNVLPVNSLKHPRAKPNKATLCKFVSVNPIKLPVK